MSSSHPSGVWTDSLIERLKELYGFNLSMSAIAEKLGHGISRNAVIGKAHRLGLPRRGQSSGASVWTEEVCAIVRPLIEAGVSPRRISIDHLQRRVSRAGIAMKAYAMGWKSPRRQPKPKPVIEPRPEAARAPRDPALRRMIAMAVPDTARPWLTREFGECAWPFGEGADTFSCCRPTLTDKPYCAEHHAIGHHHEAPSVPAARVKFYARIADRADGAAA